MFQTIAGTLIVVLILYDVFQAIIVPRTSPTAFRIAPFLLRQILWPPYLCMSSWRPFRRRREELLALFAPAAFAVLAVVWLVLLMLGFALILFGLRHDVKPEIADFPEAFYLAGTSILTLGFGDIVAIGVKARAVVLTAAVSGLMFLALEVSYLFTLQNLVQQREQMVNSLVSRSGAPASGIVILLRYKELNILNALNASFLQWESWIANILESHRAYPILLYFRSTNKTESWVSALGAMLDSASLLVVAVDEMSVGESELFYWLACSTVQALCRELKVEETGELHMTYEEYKQGLSLLQDSGYKIRDPDLSWKLFSIRRRGYIGYLHGIARAFSLPTNAWVYDLFGVQTEDQEQSESIFLPRV